MRLKVVLEPSEDGGYTVYVPSLPGCISEGETIEEALANIREAIALYLEPLEEEGLKERGLVIQEIDIWRKFPPSPTRPLSPPCRETAGLWFAKKEATSAWRKNGRKDAENYRPCAQAGEKEHPGAHPQAGRSWSGRFPSPFAVGFSRYCGKTLGVVGEIASLRSQRQKTLPDCFALLATTGKASVGLLRCARNGPQKSHCEVAFSSPKQSLLRDSSPLCGSEWPMRSVTANLVFSPFSCVTASS